MYTVERDRCHYGNDEDDDVPLLKCRYGRINRMNTGERWDTDDRTRHVPLRRRRGCVNTGETADADDRVQHVPLRKKERMR